MPCTYCTASESWAVSLLRGSQHQVAVKNLCSASTLNVFQEAAAKGKQGQLRADPVSHFKPPRHPTSPTLADTHGAIAASAHLDGPHGEGCRHSDHRSRWPHQPPCSPLLWAAAYPCTIISCPQQMLQPQSRAITWPSFCPEYPGGWFTCQYCTQPMALQSMQLRNNNTLATRFDPPREHQTLTVLLESINSFSCHHSRLLYFPWTATILFFSNQKSTKPAGVSACGRAMAS